MPLLSPPRPLPALGAPRGGSRCCSFSAPGAPRWPSGAGSTSCPPWPGPGHTMIPSPDSGRAMARHRISGCGRHPGGDVIMGDSGVTFWGPGCFSSGWDHSRPMGLPCGQYRHEGGTVSGTFWRQAPPRVGRADSRSVRTSQNGCCVSLPTSSARSRSSELKRRPRSTRQTRSHRSLCRRPWPGAVALVSPAGELEACLLRGAGVEAQRGDTAWGPRGHRVAGHGASRNWVPPPFLCPLQALHHPRHGAPDHALQHRRV